MLAEGAASRWAEAARLCSAAMAVLAEKGVPVHVAAESATLAELGWRFR